MTDSLELTETIRQGIDVITHRGFREHGRFVKAAGLSLPQFSILMQLHFQRQSGMSEICTRMNMSNAAASQLVEKLVQSELVERSEDPVDRRAKQLKLAAKGRELIDTGIEKRLLWVDKLIEALAPQEQEKVAEAMLIVTRTLQEMREREKAAESLPHQVGPK